MRYYSVESFFKTQLDFWRILKTCGIIKSIYTKHYVNPSKQDIDEFIGMIIENAMVTKNTYHIDDITLAPEDDMFIACALEGDVDYIVSRDPHLRNIKHFQRIQIIDATMFVNKLN
ncbi:MAG: PIN domain-containing protein [Desulfobacula sp.]|nr:PIN domain-containing protein [Desulfobacula sp.]